MEPARAPYAAVRAGSALASLTNSGYVDLPAGGGTVTYEVLFADSAATETAKIYPVLYYPAYFAAEQHHQRSAAGQHVRHGYRGDLRSVVFDDGSFQPDERACQPAGSVGWNAALRANDGWPV